MNPGNSPVVEPKQLPAATRAAEVRGLFRNLYGGDCRLWTAVHGVTSLLISQPAFPWTDKQAMIRQVIDSAVDGLLRRPTRS